MDNGNGRRYYTEHVLNMEHQCYNFSTCEVHEYHLEFLNNLIHAGKQKII